MRSRSCVIITFVIVLAICSLSGNAAQGRKEAAVIGNSAYATGPLRNPVNGMVLVPGGRFGSGD